MLIKIVDAGEYMCPNSKCAGINMADMRCKGSQCMAWRWADTQKWEGYCGLAGIPLALKD